MFISDYRQGQIASQDYKYLLPQGDMAYFEADARDVLAGVDHVVNMHLVDRERMAIIGHSAGSQLTNMLLTISGRFRAAISKEGSSLTPEFAKKVRSSPRQNRYKSLLWTLNATPETIDEKIIHSSPITHADEITTPVLLVGAGNAGVYGDLLRDDKAFVAAINAEGGGAGRSAFFSG